MAGSYTSAEARVPLQPEPPVTTPRFTAVYDRHVLAETNSTE
ncbi:hypothetical protein D187_001336 [Cystobacter fuscus DSM 2262]|uniref:Uncharacterized protein n=1 Tax=Cystobacter fuscus (strain ATCC 25194 / DSM 2262 / NBRC 100088 / M29) TaxID=1242864 RepID=S9PEC8_CYSF2|nr:hypothetical protein D187_001336 [Cystobacter fuscus DSM 2262]